MYKQKKYYRNRASPLPYEKYAYTKKRQDSYWNLAANFIIYARERGFH